MKQLQLYRRVRRNFSSFLLKKFSIRFKDYRNHTLRTNTEVLNLLLRIREEDRAEQLLEELYNIHQLAKNTNHLDGDIAEVGVYKGGLAKLLAISKGARALHLFDSFEGMISTSKHIDIHSVGDFNDTSLEAVKQYLFGFDNLYLHKGWFPCIAEPIKDKIFSLVHLDVDLYQSTLDALGFFYERMVRGGIILSHDYNSLSCPGVAKAFNEFFTGKEETVIELGGTSQCLVVKL